MPGHAQTCKWSIFSTLIAGGSSDSVTGFQSVATYCYSAPGKEAEYCDERVCLSVCLCVSVCVFVHDHIFGTTHPIFTKILVHVTYDRGSVLVKRRSDTLCTSGFIDDVIFAHKPRLLDVAA